MLASFNRSHSKVASLRNLAAFLIFAFDTAGPADLLVCNPKSGIAYVGHDDANHLWVVDAAEKKVVSTVDLPSDSPEGLGFDSQGMRLFQAMKTGSIVAVVDVAINKVIEKWPTAPASSPHGIAIAP